MKLVPVSLGLFYRTSGDLLEVWVQHRIDDGPYHGLLEFPGGGIEPGEDPNQAAAREIKEEVGIEVEAGQATFFGLYSNQLSNRTVLLYVFLFPEHGELEGKGQWLQIRRPDLSEAYRGKIPSPNHQMIDELYRALYDKQHE